MFAIEDGTLDNSFDPGSGANNQILTTTPQPDGKIIVGGEFTSFNGTGRNYITRLNTDGSDDVSFDPGTGPNLLILTTAIQTDGKIIIGGQFTSYNGTARNYIARLNTDGTLDNSFDPGTGPNNIITTISLQNNGKIIIGGWFTAYNGTTKNYLVRLNEDGTLDNGFDYSIGAIINVIAL